MNTKPTHISWALENARMTVARCRSFALAFACVLPLFLSSTSNGSDDVFVPFDFQKLGVAPGNMTVFYHALTGSELGGTTLESCGKAALIEFMTPDSREQYGFSFAFDEKIIKKHSVIENSQARDLLVELRLMKGYGENKYEHSNAEAYRKAWENPIAIELSDGRRFLRVYFDRTFSHCYYVSCSGEVGHEWMVAPQIAARLKALANSFAENGLPPRAEGTSKKPLKPTAQPQKEEMKPRANQ